MYSKYANLRDKRGVTDYGISKSTGIPQTTLSDWKRRSESNPDASLSVENLRKIAEYFGKNLDYFVK